MGLQQNPTIFLTLSFRKSNPHPSPTVGNGHYFTSLSSVFNISPLGAVTCLCNFALHIFEIVQREENLYRCFIWDKSQNSFKMKVDNCGKESNFFQKQLLPIQDIMACNSKATNQKTLQESIKTKLLALYYVFII